MLADCVLETGGGQQGSRKSHTPAKGGTIPKVTHITSPEFCPDTPLTFLSLFLSLSLSISFFPVLFFITIKGQPEPKDRGPNPELPLLNLWEAMKAKRGIYQLCAAKVEKSALEDMWQTYGSLYQILHNNGTALKDFLHCD